MIHNVIEGLSNLRQNLPEASTRDEKMQNAASKNQKEAPVKRKKFPVKINAYQNGCIKKASNG
jgi:hypothetical protein